MREIKFRAWDKENKRWSNELFIIGGKIKIDKLLPIYKAENNEWVQWTGLLDKNGKEIYEGDIIKDPYNAIAKVKFNAIGWEPWINGVNLPFAGYPPFSSPEEMVEVIGNIYESPKLLK